MQALAANVLRLPRQFRNPSGDPVRGGLHRIVGEVGIGDDGLNLGVSDLLADHGQAFPDHQPVTAPGPRWFFTAPELPSGPALPAFRGTNLRLILIDAESHLDCRAVPCAPWNRRMVREYPLSLRKYPKKP